MLALHDLQEQVGDWSWQNFGAQVSKAPTPPTERPGTEGVPVDNNTGTLPRVLGSLNPLRGIGEELGELADALGSQDKAASEDAVGDVMIYLCDWAYREGFVLVQPPETGAAPLPHREPMRGLMSAYGRMCHATLKRDQGIRGMLHRETYTAAINEAVHELLRYLHQYTRMYHPKTSLLAIVNGTWAKVVSKRDWNANPGTGTAPAPADMLEADTAE